MLGFFIIDLFSWVFLRVLYGDKCPDMYNKVFERLK